MKRRLVYGVVSSSVFWLEKTGIRAQLYLSQKLYREPLAKVLDTFFKA